MRTDSAYDPLSGPTTPVFVRYALPSVLGLAAFSSAAVIDAIFIGRFVGAEALAAVNLTIPATSMMSGLAMMLAIGGSVAAGKFLGEGQAHKAGDVFSKTLIANILLCSILTLIFLWLTPQLVWLVGSTEALAPLVTEYLRISLMFFPAMVLGISYYYFTMIDSRPVLASTSVCLSAIVNIVLDWWFIVELDMGLTGAALGTGLAISSMTLFMAPMLWLRPGELRFRRPDRDWMVVVRSAYNGLSEFVNEISVGVITLMFNWILIARMGALGVAAYSVVEYLLFILVMIYYGLAEAMQPLVSKNFGAKQPERSRAFFKLALIGAGIAGALAAIMVLSVPEQLISLFLRPEDYAAIEMADVYLAWFWPAFVLIGFNICISGYLTALHQPRRSAIIAVLRSLILPALMLTLAPRYLGDIGIFLAIPVSESLTLAVAIFMLYGYRKKQSGEP